MARNDYAGVETVQIDNPFEPKILDELVKMVGADSVDYTDKLLCCGGSYARARRFGVGAGQRPAAAQGSIVHKSHSVYLHVVWPGTGIRSEQACDDWRPGRR